MTDVCLFLLGAPELEEQLLDQLLLHPLIRTFTSQAIASHGVHPSELDASEQVLGRGDGVLIQAVLAGSDADALLTDLRRQLAGSKLRYWLCPVLTQGEIE
ncbi:DUF3240 family protein [Permianibacter sp. IMCC34836]|uniref:DUF3240 family protein n=1 Tax=Permianibacter fluminis TaxID=2738515 RepID=UPI0015564DBA|nr:DUF3240 family protein [Permianibacter fluminis]NQD38265.1 DUF3240 family protein [Permianibacter fluminis]